MEDGGMEVGNRRWRALLLEIPAADAPRSTPAFYLNRLTASAFFVFKPSGYNI
jgi:hypothetical protein